MYSLQPLRGGVFLNSIMLMNMISTDGAQPGVSGWLLVNPLYLNHLKNLQEIQIYIFIEYSVSNINLHHEAHVAEEQHQEQNLWHKLQQDGGVALEVHKVEDGHANAKDHVQYADDDGQLHLEAVEKDDLVISELPNGIQAQRIDALSGSVWRHL